MVVSLGDTEEGQPSPHLGEGTAGRHHPGTAQAAYRKVREAGILHTMPPVYGPTGPRESLVKRREVCIFSSVSGCHTPTWQVVMRNRW